MTFIRVAPVRKSILVNAAQAHAFDVFAKRFDAWWPKDHHIGKSAMREAVIEPRAGGRWYEKGEDGSECDWGRVLAWEPPNRLVLSWTINGKFQVDESVESEVEVRFLPESANKTRVELEHRIAAADAQALREAVDSPRGWGILLEIYAKKAAARSPTIEQRKETAMSLKLYAFPPSPRGFKVLFAAHQLGLDYEFHLVDLTKGDQKAPAFVALNPNGRMPVLDDGGFVLWESNAIVEYLASKAGALPKDTRDRLVLTKWLYWESNHWDTTCAIYVFERLVKPFFGLGETSEAEIAKAETTFHRLAGVLNGELEKHRYVTGDALTIADLAIVSSLCVAERVNYPLEKYRAIQRWHADLKNLPAWSRTSALQQPPGA